MTARCSWPRSSTRRATGFSPRSRRELGPHPERLPERRMLGEGGFQPSNISLSEGHRPARAATGAGVGEADQPLALRRLQQLHLRGEPLAPRPLRDGQLLHEIRRSPRCRRPRRHAEHARREGVPCPCRLPGETRRLAELRDAGVEIDVVDLPAARALLRREHDLRGAGEERQRQQRRLGRGRLPAGVRLLREAADVEQAGQVPEQPVEDHLHPERAVRGVAAREEANPGIEQADRQWRAESRSRPGRAGARASRGRTRPTARCRRRPRRSRSASTRSSRSRSRDSGTRNRRRRLPTA